MGGSIFFAIAPLDGDLTQGDVFAPIGIALAILAAGALIYLLVRSEQGT